MAQFRGALEGPALQAPNAGVPTDPRDLAHANRLALGTKLFADAARPIGRPASHADIANALEQACVFPLPCETVTSAPRAVATEQGPQHLALHGQRTIQAAVRDEGNLTVTLW